ncbi:MAG: aldo/keto reductase [Porphyromonadaceae bacterium]|nr:aldo/keto reductase [Porphyromonadaceae bacterium]
MKALAFSNLDKIPLIGLGTWLSRPNEVFDAVIEAIDVGYRHIDCAYIYKNEKEVGAALKYLFDFGIIQREQIFITSKLWNSFHRPEEVENAARKSIEDLQLDYLDLYLMHWPIAFKREKAEGVDDLISLDELPLEETWKAMKELKQKGLVKHIGVSNFNIPKLKKLMATGLKPEMNQIEIHPYLQQDELVDFCFENGIMVTAYSPLGSRHLMSKDDSIANNPVIREIASKHDCKATQVMLAWNMRRGIIVIPKSVNPERINENFGANSVELDEDDIQKIKTINRNQRNATAAYAVFPGGPYTFESIWEE